MAEIFGNTTATPIKPDLFRNKVDNTFDPTSDNAQSGKAVAEALTNYYTKEEVNSLIGDVETALDSIIAIQENLIGGGSV